MYRPLAACLTAISLMMPSLGVAHDLSEAEIKELALEAIRENPGIVMEAVRILEEQQAADQAAQAATVLSSNREFLERDPNAPVVGNVDGTVTVVEFFDYNCPYCRRAGEQLEVVMEADSDVRIVMREWPILGDESVFAARAALAARAQGKYEEMHWALMEMRGRANEDTVMRAAEEIGLDAAQLRKDMDAPEVDQHIEQSMELARAIGFSGTPSFVIGDVLLPGFVEADQMLEAISEARTN